MPDRADTPPSFDELAPAVRLAIASEPTGRPRDALCAFVHAWWRQWPRAFARAFGDDAANVRAWVDGAIGDRDRHIKLSRIATEHLAQLL
jgi:hypothetical protein